MYACVASCMYNIMYAHLLSMTCMHASTCIEALSRAICPPSSKTPFLGLGRGLSFTPGKIIYT